MEIGTCARVGRTAYRIVLVLETDRILLVEDGTEEPVMAVQRPNGRWFLDDTAREVKIGERPGNYPFPPDWDD